MRFESFENRLLLAGVPVVAIQETIADDFVVGPLATALALNVAVDDSRIHEFGWSSKTASRDEIEQFRTATLEWNSNLPVVGNHQFSDTDWWFKSFSSQSLTVADEGYLIAQRRASDRDEHTMLVARKTTDVSPSFLNSGLYLNTDHHYQISFDVRFPESEASWLTNHRWSIVMQMWGPKDPGEQSFNPPFSIYTSAVNGVPYWNVRARGDSHLITTPGDYESDLVSVAPVGTIGDWHHWDIEYVPNAFGQGLVRVWLNGIQVADWTNVQNAFHGMHDGAPIGPVNPAFGLYAPLAEDGMEAHFDNISIKSGGAYERSISGVASSQQSGALITAVDVDTSERYTATTGAYGVFSLPVPAGFYTVTAQDLATGERVTVADVDAATESPLLNLEIPLAAPLSLAADVDGDGVDEIITRDVADGLWRVAEASDVEMVVEVWGQWSSSTNWSDVLAGDFNGDGFADLMGRADSGEWWAARSDGERFYNEPWGAWSPAVDWLDVFAADVDGDGRDDLVGRAADDTWWVARSDGARFHNEPWGAWSTSVEWLDVQTADVDGDGRDDLVGRSAANGQWWVARSDGAQFHNEHWGGWSTAVNWLDVQTADVNGDGRDDLVGRVASSGEWWVARSDGARFFNEHWGAWSTAVDWLDVQVADVNGDGRDDLVGRAEASGEWWVARSGDSRFFNEISTTWSNQGDWWLALIAAA